MLIESDATSLDLSDKRKGYDCKKNCRKKYIFLRNSCFCTSLVCFWCSSVLSRLSHAHSTEAHARSCDHDNCISLMTPQSPMLHDDTTFSFDGSSPQCVFEAFPADKRWPQLVFLWLSLGYSWSVNLFAHTAAAFNVTAVLFMTPLTFKCHRKLPAICV